MLCCFCVFFFKQKTAYEMRISDWSSDVCSSDLEHRAEAAPPPGAHNGSARRSRADGRGSDDRWVSSFVWLSLGTVESVSPPSRRGVQSDHRRRSCRHSFRRSAEFEGDRKSTPLNSSH